MNVLKSALWLLLLSHDASSQVAVPTYRIALTASESAADFGRAVATVDIPASASSDGSQPKIKTGTSEQWLIAEASTTELPTLLTLRADPAGLEEGIHRASVTVRNRLDGKPLAYVDVQLDVVATQYLQHLTTGTTSGVEIVVINTSSSTARLRMRFRHAETGGRDRVARPWVFPFAERTPTDTIVQTIAPLATVVFKSKNGSPSAKGWAEIQSDRRLVCRAISRFPLAVPGAVNIATYRALSARTTPLYLPFENTSTVSTALVVANPSTETVTGTMRFFDGDGLKLAASQVLRLDAKQLRAFAADEYLGAAYTNATRSGLAVLEGAEGVAFMAGAIRRSRGSTSLLPASGPAPSLPTVRGFLSLGESQELGDAVLMNPGHRGETALFGLWGPQARMEDLRSTTVYVGRESSVSVGVMARWAETAAPETVAVLGSYRRSADVGETIEEATKAQKSSLIWPAEPGEAELAIANVSDEAATVFIVLRKQGLPPDPIRVELSAGVGVRLAQRCPSLSLADGPAGFWEVVNVNGARLVGAVRRTGPVNSIEQSLRRP